MQASSGDAAPTRNPRASRRQFAMRRPFRRSRRLPTGRIQRAAARAGLVRLAIRQRTLHPSLMQPRRMKRMLHGLRRA
jgi:hypothetical protein